MIIREMVRMGAKGVHGKGYLQRHGNKLNFEDDVISKPELENTAGVHSTTKQAVEMRAKNILLLLF